jgi:hypothetical protein
MPTAEPQTLPEPGTRMRDKEHDKNPVLVLSVPGDRADEHYIEALDRTVAACATNYNYPDDDPVIEVAYVSALNRELMGRRGIEWTPESAVEMYEDGVLDECQMTFYSMPLSRLSPTE